MSHDNLENRLNKLKKSYDKLPSAQRVEDTVVQVEQQLNKKKTRKWLKPVATFAAAACIFVTGGLTWGFLQKPEEEQGLLASYQEIQENELLARLEAEEAEKQRLSNQAYDEWLERLGILYTEWREAARVDLQLDEDTFGQLSYVIYADFRFEDYLGRMYRDNFDWPNEEREQRYEAELYTMIATPNQMLEKRLIEPDFYTENQYKFIDMYAKKIFGLKDFTYARYDMDASDPIVKEMEKQLLFVVQTNFGQRIQYNWSLMESKLIESGLSKSELGFLENIKMDSFLYGGEFLYSIDDTIDSLCILEHVLLDKGAIEYDQYDDLKTYYIRAMIMLLEGTIGEAAIEQGEVSPAFKYVLERLISESQIVSDFAETTLTLKGQELQSYMAHYREVTIEAAVLQAQSISE